MQVLRINQTEWLSKVCQPCTYVLHSLCLAVALFTDNKEYDAYLSYTKVDLDCLGRSVISVQDFDHVCWTLKAC